MLIPWGVVMFAVKLLKSNVAGRLTELGTSCSMLLWDSAVAFEHCRDFLPTFHWAEWSQEIFDIDCCQKSPKVEKIKTGHCAVYGATKQEASGKCLFLWPDAADAAEDIAPLLLYTFPRSLMSTTSLAPWIASWRSLISLPTFTSAIPNHPT